MADFDEAKAKEIIQDFELSETTLRVWKSRNSIPKKYLKEGFKKLETIPDTPETRRLRAIISRKEFRMTQFRTATLNPNYQRSNSRLSDIKKGSRFLEAEVKKLKEEIVEIRNLCRAVIDTRTDAAIKALCEDKRIKPTLILAVDMYKQIVDGVTPLTRSQKDIAVLAITAFNNLINL